MTVIVYHIRYEDMNMVLEHVNAVYINVLCPKVF